MGKVIPLRPSEREVSAAEALGNIEDAFERFCKAIEETKETEMKYVSRKYLREKWESLKWDMEKVVGVYDEESDDVAEDAQRVRDEIADLMESIKKELGA